MKFPLTNVVWSYRKNAKPAENKTHCSSCSGGEKGRPSEDGGTRLKKILMYQELKMGRQLSETAGNRGRYFQQNPLWILNRRRRKGRRMRRRKRRSRFPTSIGGDNTRHYASSILCLDDSNMRRIYSNFVGNAIDTPRLLEQE